LLLGFIRKLAEYENLQDQVVADEQSLEYWIFEKDKAEALIGEYGGKPVGFALFFHNFSTFLGRARIYIEDIFVDEEYRGRGLGRAFFKRISEIALERGCGRIEWWSLKWNKPSNDFYRSLGAASMEELGVFRLSEDQILKLARNELE